MGLADKLHVLMAGDIGDLVGPLVFVIVVIVSIVSRVLQSEKERQRKLREVLERQMAEKQAQAPGGVDMRTPPPPHSLPVPGGHVEPWPQPSGGHIPAPPPHMPAPGHVPSPQQPRTRTDAPRQRSARTDAHQELQARTDVPRQQKQRTDAAQGQAQRTRTQPHLQRRGPVLQQPDVPVRPVPQAQRRKKGRQPKVTPLPEAIRASVAQHMATEQVVTAQHALTGTSPPTARYTTTVPTMQAEAIARWMQPNSLRQQFILTEILRPPLALRDPDERF